MLQEVSKGIAAATAFSGQLISVAPEHVEYYSGQNVRIHIQSHIEADGLPWYDVYWFSYFRVYDVDSEELLAEAKNRHWSLPWNTYDEADEDFYQPIGQMPNRTLNLQVELYGTLGWPSPFVLCDYKQCSVSLVNGGPPPPPPPPEGEFPWKWVAVGSGVLIVAALLFRLRGK